MKRSQPPIFRALRFLIAVACCVSTAAVAAPAKKKPTKETDVLPMEPVRAMPALPVDSAPEKAPEKETKSPTKKKRSSRSVEQQPVEYLPGGVPATGGAAVIVIDARSGAVLYEKNADAQRAAASTQKILTSLVIAERGFLDQKVTVMPTDTYAEPTKLNIKAGETYQRIDLLRALLVKSPNDVARCLARDTGGSLESFATMMNQKARELGATNSHFINPNGLPMPGQYSTARDLSIIARAAYANPIIRSIVCQPKIVFRYADGRTRELENTNKLLTRLPYCNGMKTGYTDAAGNCLISSAARPGRDVIAVVLGDSSRPRLWKDSVALLSWALWM